MNEQKKIVKKQHKIQSFSYDFKRSSPSDRKLRRATSIYKVKRHNTRQTFTQLRYLTREESEINDEV